MVTKPIYELTFGKGIKESVYPVPTVPAHSPATTQLGVTWPGSIGMWGPEFPPSLAPLGSCPIPFGLLNLQLQLFNWAKVNPCFIDFLTDILLIFLTFIGSSGASPSLVSSNLNDGGNNGGSPPPAPPASSAP